MNEMIERGAKALFEEGCRRAMAKGIMPSGPVGWEDLAESSRNDYRQSSRAHLLAMRESTGVMDAAADKLTVQIDGVSVPPIPEIAWSAMIDAALSE